MRTKPFLVILVLWILVVILFLLVDPPVHAQAACSVRGDWPVYTVARGDTLYRIARRFNTTTAILSSANCLTNSNRINVGQVLHIPSPGGVATLPPIQGANRPITFQPYEGGYMLWWAESGEIWVLSGAQNGSITVFPARSYGSLPENPVGDATPTSRVRPIMGFGRVWGNFSSVRGQLGWATAPEQSYISVFSYDPVNRNSTFTVPGGRRLYSDGRIWNIFTGTLPTQPPPSPIPPTPVAGGWISVRGSYQPFENGFMTWRSDTGEIQVYFGLNNGSTTAFLADFYGSLPDNPFTNPPAGRVRPILGFGRVWANANAVRDQLGWATAPELGYIMQIQQSTPLVRLIGVPAGANGSTRWIFNDRGLYWDFTNPPTGTPPVVATSTPPTVATGLFVTTNAAYQVFEDGFMVWRADTGDIWVFPKHAPVNQFGLFDYENLPDNPVKDVPPEARLSPINGFGRVWGNVAPVRQQLGWALDSEKSYQATLHSIYVASPDGMKSLLGECLNLPDGSSVRFPEYADNVTITWGLVDSCG